MVSLNGQGFIYLILWAGNRVGGLLKGCTAVAVHRHFAVRRGTSKVQSILMRSPGQRIHRGLFTVHVFAYLCVHNVLFTVHVFAYLCVHNVVEELRDSSVGVHAIISIVSQPRGL